MVADVLDRHGRIDVLISNAGGAMAAPRPAEEIGLGDWNRALSGDLTGTWPAAKAVIPAMKRAGRGTLINVWYDDEARLSPGPGALHRGQGGRRGAHPGARLTLIRSRSSPPPRRASRMSARSRCTASSITVIQGGLHR
ncbi:hypothetical protein GCM10010187_47950 [Actinomadura coerulea]|nr:hypothetical protein GCM10010187_47950 [Actinomadura coerulea]